MTHLRKHVTIHHTKIIINVPRRLVGFCILWVIDMARLTDKDWLEIKTKYQAGHKLRDIAKEYNYDAGNITKRAKKDGWVHGEIQQEILSKANAVSDLITSETKIQQKIQQNQTEIVNREVFALAELKNVAKDVQQSMLNLIKLASEQAKNIIENNPSGLHVKSQGDSTSYGRNTEFVKDLIPAMNAANAILGIGKESKDTNIQINNDQQDKVTINIIGE